MVRSMSRWLPLLAFLMMTGCTSLPDSARGRSEARAVKVAVGTASSRVAAAARRAATPRRAAAWKAAAGGNAAAGDVPAAGRARRWGRTSRDEDVSAAVMIRIE